MNDIYDIIVRPMEIKNESGVPTFGSMMKMQNRIWEKLTAMFYVPIGTKNTVTCGIQGLRIDGQYRIGETKLSIANIRLNKILRDASVGTCFVSNCAKFIKSVHGFNIK